MCKFDVVSGRVTEAHRFINVPLRWAEEYPARERREIWVATLEGTGDQTGGPQPADAGTGGAPSWMCCCSMVGWLACGTSPPGLQVNFMRVDPPWMWTRSDSLLMAVILLASFVALLFGSVAAAFAGLVLVVFIPVLMLLRRFATRVRTRRKVDVALEEIGSCWVGRCRLLRVR